MPKIAMSNYLIQSSAAEHAWKLMHHEYHCEDCKLCENCRTMSDDPMMVHDATLYLCKDCKVCPKSMSAGMLSSMESVEVSR